MGKKKSKPFEKQMQDIEAIIEKLDSGELALEKSLELYEKGIGIVKDCHAILNKAESKMRLLLDDTGQVTTEESDANE